MRRCLLLIALVACKDESPVAPEPPWTARTELPAPRFRASAVGVGSQLFVIGGFANATEIATDVLAYDPFEDTWTVATYPDKWLGLPARAPSAVVQAGVATVGGSIYLFGGHTGAAPIGDAWRLQPQAATWTALEPMPPGEERFGAAVVASAGHIFLLGGTTAAGATDSILDYEITSNTWTVLPIRLKERVTGAAAMRDGEGTFVIAGGVVGTAIGMTWALRLGAADWEPRAPMPTPRFDCAYGVVYGQLVCAGGSTTTGVSAAVDAYDPTLDEWTATTAMPLARTGAAGAVVSSRLYVAGGADAPPAPTTTLFEFDLLDTLPR